VTAVSAALGSAASTSRSYLIGLTRRWISGESRLVSELRGQREQAPAGRRPEWPDPLALEPDRIESPSGRSEGPLAGDTTRAEVPMPTAAPGESRADAHAAAATAAAAEFAKAMGA